MLLRFAVVVLAALTTLTTTLTASLAGMAHAAEPDQGVTFTGSTWTVRTLYLALATRVGTSTTSCTLEYVLTEYNETGILSAREARDRARVILARGLDHDAGGRLAYVPARRVELVEVYEITR